MYLTAPRAFALASTDAAFMLLLEKESARIATTKKGAFIYTEKLALPLDEAFAIALVEPTCKEAPCRPFSTDVVITTEEPKPPAFASPPP